MYSFQYCGLSCRIFSINYINTQTTFHVDLCQVPYIIYIQLLQTHYQRRIGITTYLQLFLSSGNNKQLLSGFVVAIITFSVLMAVIASSKYVTLNPISISSPEYSTSSSSSASSCSGLWAKALRLFFFSIILTPLYFSLDNIEARVRLCFKSLRFAFKELFDSPGTTRSYSGNLPSFNLP